MRISIVLLIFLVLLNTWGGLMQTYHIDDQLGINAETGHSKELNQAANGSQDFRTGSAIGATLLGYYNGLVNTMQGLILGLQPGAQILANLMPSGIARDIVVWAFGILPIIIVTDLYSYARGSDL